MGKTVTYRSTVISLYKAGYSASHIQKFSHSFIYKTIKQFRETSSLNDRPKSDRSRTKATGGTIERVKQLIKSNPCSFLMKLAKHVSTSKTTVHCIVKEHLRPKAFKKVPVQMLSSTDRQYRLAKLEAFLGRFIDDDLDHIVFSNEKMFTVV
jgi:transposase